MLIETLKQHLIDGTKLVFAKRMTENEKLRSCYALVFDRRKGFHVVEQSFKQLRDTMQSGAGIYLIQLKDDKFQQVSRIYGEELILEIPEEEEESLYSTLPRYDFTAQVQVKKLLKKIGFFR